MLLYNQTCGHNVWTLRYSGQQLLNWSVLDGELNSESLRKNLANCVGPQEVEMGKHTALLHKFTRAFSSSGHIVEC